MPAETLPQTVGDTVAPPRRAASSSSRPTARPAPRHRPDHEAQLSPSIDPAPAIRRIVMACLAAGLALVALDWAFNWSPAEDDLSVARIFDMTREASLPTFFGAAQAALVGATALCIVLVLRARRAPRRELLGWASIAAFFVIVAADDGARVHERVGTAIGNAFAPDAGGGPPVIEFLLRTPSYYWIAVLGPLFAAFGVFMLVFLWRQLRPLGLRHVVVVGLVLYAAAIGIDFAEGTGGVFESLASRLGASEYSVEHFLRVTEEYLELVATTVFLFAALSFLAWKSGGLRLQIAAQDSVPRSSTQAPGSDA